MPTAPTHNSTIPPVTKDLGVSPVLTFSSHALTKIHTLVRYVDSLPVHPGFNKGEHVYEELTHVIGWEPMPKKKEFLKWFQEEGW